MLTKKSQKKHFNGQDHSFLFFLFFFSLNVEHNDKLMLLSCVYSCSRISYLLEVCRALLFSFHLPYSLLLLTIKELNTRLNPLSLRNQVKKKSVSGCKRKKKDAFFATIKHEDAPRRTTGATYTNS